MKSKIILIFPVIVLLLASLACGRGAGTAVPVSQPTVQQSPIPSATPTITPTPNLVITGPCANVFYPFSEGRQWIYENTGDPATEEDDTRFGLTVASVTDTQATLNALDLGTGTTFQTTVDCDNSAIKNFPLMTVGSLFGNYLQGDVNVKYVSGVFMPTETEFTAANWNTQWSGQYVASGNIQLEFEGVQTPVKLNDSPIKMEWQNAGQESVTVPAGTFDNAYKVTRKVEVEASLDFNGLIGQGTLTVKTAHWFVPYLGLIKSEPVSAEILYTGVSFPVSVKGAVELVEFRPGP